MAILINRAKFCSVSRLHNLVFMSFISLKDLSAVAVPTGIETIMSISLNVSEKIPV